MQDNNEPQDSVGSGGQFPVPRPQPSYSGAGGSGPVPPPRSGRPSGKTRGWLIAVATALVAGLIAGYLVHGSSTAAAAPAPTKTVVKTVVAAPPPAPTDSTSASAASTAAVTSDPSATDSSGASTGPDATGLGTVSLINLTPASGHFNNGDTKPTLNGQAQTFAISDTISGSCGYNGNTSSNDVGYDLGRNYTKFTAVFGVEDVSPDETLAPQIEIDGDGLKLATYNPKLGHSAPATLNVTGVLRLDIKWSFANSQCGALGYLVIGNGQLTAVPGYHPSPAASSN